MIEFPQITLFQKVLIFFSVAGLVLAGIWLYNAYRRRQSGVVVKLLTVDKNTGEVYLDVNGKVKRAVMEPNTVRSFSAGGHATIITTEVDNSTGKPRASVAKLYVYKPDDTIDPTQTQEIVLI